MDGMLLLGLVFAFGFGLALGLNIGARAKEKAIEELKRRLTIGLSKIVANAKRPGKSDELWLLGDSLERWIPKRGKCYPPGNWPDPPPSRRPEENSDERD